MKIAMSWEQLLSCKRFGLESRQQRSSEHRSEFQRDYDRLIFSAPFRRLQNKTQVFPLPGSVFVHNRLTHSLEVSSVGRSLGQEVAQLLSAAHPELAKLFSSLSSIVSAACLAHDLGNPPFGHSGETAIGTFFSEGKGRFLQDKLSADQWADLTLFEGNANALRLLTHRFQGRREGGFALTYATLASIVKYPYPSSQVGDKRKFGFFATEQESYHRIATELGIPFTDESAKRYARHPLVFLVEAADDICYCLVDIEDAHKLRILSYKETEELFLGFFNLEQRRTLTEMFDVVTDLHERIAYLRSCIIGLLVKECARCFTNNEVSILQGTYTVPLIKSLPPHITAAYRKCATISSNRIYCSQEVLDVELGGYRILHTLLDHLVQAVYHPDKAYSELLLKRVPSQYAVQSDSLSVRVQSVVDYVSGMTDIYALELYRKIKGSSLPAV